MTCQLGFTEKLMAFSCSPFAPGSWGDREEAAATLAPPLWRHLSRGLQLSKDCTAGPYSQSIARAGQTVKAEGMKVALAA